jgi:hypothetical protein
MVIPTTQNVMTLASSHTVVFFFLILLLSVCSLMCGGGGWAGTTFFQVESSSGILTMIPTTQNVLALASSVAVNSFDPAAIRHLYDHPPATTCHKWQRWGRDNIFPGRKLLWHPDNDSYYSECLSSSILSSSELPPVAGW